MRHRGQHQTAMPAIATDAATAWSVRLSVCRLRAKRWTKKMPGTFVWTQVTLYSVTKGPIGFRTGRAVLRWKPNLEFV